MSIINGKELKVKEVKDHIVEMTGGFHRDEGLHFGDPNAKVRKIMVCWMADNEAIEHAAKIGANLIITHESLFYPYDVVVNGRVPEFMSWKTNASRIEQLARAGISVIRAHGSLDKLCIFDDFASLLQLGTPAVSEPDYVKIYEVSSVTYGQMIERVKQALNLKQLRATNGDRNREVKRVGLPWGGMALFVNVGYMQKLVEHECDLLIAGETDNYGLRFALGAGIDMIETSHEVSENPGLKHFAEMLAQDLPAIEVEFYGNQMPWVYV
jgi:putative NIF3 family GTP cyclohydrolase 1 type 2